MSARSPRWARGSTARRAASVNPQLRVSDAERAEVADRLSKHYGDGRLDQAEFNERLDQAMKAKTQSDLNGLFADLPAAEEPDETARQQDVRTASDRPRHRTVALILIIVIAALIGHSLTVSFVPFFFWPALAGSYIPWILIGLLVFLWLRHGSRHRRRP